MGLIIKQTNVSKLKKIQYSNERKHAISLTEVHMTAKIILSLWAVQKQIYSRHLKIRL